MSSAEVLQRAIQAARAGRRVEARDLLIELVEVDPRNEMAWIWQWRPWRKCGPRFPALS